MGTKKTDTQTNQFNPAGNAAYNQMTPAFGQRVTDFMKNPYGNPQFQLEQQMGNRQAAQYGQRGMGNLLQNQQASGFGGGPQSPFMQEMMANQGRANSGMQAQLGFMNPSMMANQRQMQAMNMAGQYRPLQTGQTNVEQTSGLGTWLPQTLGAIAGVAAAPFTGGLSLGALGGLMNRGSNSSGWAGSGQGMTGNAPGGWGGGGGYSSLPFGSGSMGGVPMPGGPGSSEWAPQGGSSE